MKTIIVDGNNLIHKIKKIKDLYLKDSTSAQLSLQESIKTYIEKNVKLIIYFDGTGSSRQKEIVYTGNDTADNLIKEYINKNYTKEKITVVSSDNEITRFARVCSCKVIKSEDFYKEIQSSSIHFGIMDNSEKPNKITRKELEEFKRLFGEK